jgi:hypothetical protein
MLEIEKCGQCGVTRKVAKPIKWTGGIFQLVELLYALHRMECFNDGKISLKNLFSTVCIMFDFDVENFSRIFVEIKKRSGDRTIFLDELKKALMGYMDLSEKK